MSLTPEDVRKIAKEESRKGQASNVLNGTIASAAIDGTITWYDISIVALIAVCACFLAVFVWLGCWLVGLPFWSAVKMAGRVILTGAALGGFRLLIDAINPLGFVTEWNEFREWKRAYYEPPETEHTIKLEIPNGNGFRFLHFDAEQTKKAIEFARQYLAVESTVEKHYVGSGKIWSNSESGRAEWSQFKSALLEHKLAYEEGNRWFLRESGKRAMRKLASAEI